MLKTVVACSTAHAEWASMSTHATCNLVMAATKTFIGSKSRKAVKIAVEELLRGFSQHWHLNHLAKRATK